MKSISFLIYPKLPAITLVLVLSAMLGSCDRAVQTDDTVAADYFIQRIDSETKSSSATNTTQTVYTYDDSKNLVCKAYTTTTKQVSTALETVFSITTDNTYNVEGYLTATTTRTIDRASGAGAVGIPAMTQRSSTTTYAYTAGRVSSYTTVDTNTDGSQSTRTGTYTYDPATEQVRQTVSADVNFSRTYTYTKGILTDYVERNGTAETRPWELQNGVITRYTIPGGLVTTYQYDDQLRPIRMDEFVNGKQTRYTTWTNAAIKPGSAAVPVQKGFPDLLPMFGREGVRTSEKQYYINSVSGQLQQFSELQMANEANGQGFVSSRTTTTRMLNPQTLPQVETTVETYTYK